MLKLIDIYGMEFKLTFNHQEKFKNELGGTFTIITLLSVLGMLWAFGQQIITKSNPRIVQSTLTSPDRLNYTLDFPLAVTVERSYQDVIDDWEKYFSFKATYIYSTTSDKGEITENQKPLQMTKCTPDKFKTTVRNQYDLLDINKTLCLLDKPLIGGYFNMYSYKYVEIYLSICNNSTENNNSCYPKDKIASFIKQVDKYLVIFYQNFVFTPTNFNNPFGYYIKSYYHYIGYSSCRRIDLNTYEMNITTDYGWLLTSEESHGTQSIDEIDTDYYIKQSSDDDCLTRIVITPSENNVIVQRSYMKIQDLLAQIGGLSTGLRLVFSIIIGMSYKRRMNEEIIQGLFEMESQDFGNIGELKKTNSKSDLKNQENQEKELKDINENIKIVQSFQNIPPDNSNLKESNLLNKVDDTKPDNIEISKSFFHLKKQKNFRKDSISIFTKVYEGNKTETDLKNQEYIVKFQNFYKNKFEEEKRKLKNKNPKNYFFSLFDNYFLLLCFCCANKKMRDLNSKYNKLIEYVIKDTDIVNMSQKFSEIEKLKFILLNPNQLAMFNLQTRLQNPLNSQLNRLTELYNFTHNLEAQNKALDEFLNSFNGEKIPSAIDRKLIDFVI